MDLEFSYFALGIFKDPRSLMTELRVIKLDGASCDEAVEQAEELLQKYAIDFALEYDGAFNMYESGSDMFEAYHEVFSMTWKSDRDFDTRLNDIVGSES